MSDNQKRQLVPRLRFPEFRKSEDWQTPRLADLYDFKRTNILSRDKLNYEGGTIKNIHYGDIHTKFRAIFRVEDESVPYVNPELSEDSFDDADYCEVGDIVLADASEDLNDVGKAIEIISLDGQRLVAGTHTILATRRGHEPIVGFGGYLFQSAAVRAGIQKEAQGAKVFGISANRISPISVPLPRTHAEQKKIADCLSSLDDLIAAEGRKLVALRDHKKGMMQQLFPREGETHPRLRFPEFRDAGEWEEKTIETLARVTQGGTPDTSNGEYWDGTINWMTPAEMGKGDSPYIGSTMRTLTEEGLNNCSSELLPAHSVIVSTRAPIGHIAINTVPIAINQGCRGLVPVEDAHFLYYALLRAKPRLMDFGAGNTFKELSGSALKRFVLQTPSPPEQQKIADCLSALDVLITAQAEKLDALRTHKRGLMQQLFPSPEELGA